MTRRFSKRTLAVLILVPASICAADDEQVRIRLEATDLAGKPVSMVGVGDGFFLNAFVQDLTEAAAGVFSSYMDLTYPMSFVAINGDINYSSPYKNGKQGNAQSPGLVDEVGAFGGLSELDDRERLLFTLGFRAEAVGNAIFATDPAESVIGDVLVYGLDDRVPPELVSYGDVMVSIFPQSCNLSTVAAPIGDLDGDKSVGFGDFLILSLNFGKPVERASLGDIDCNGEVTFADFLVLSQAFGQSAVIAEAVPEPEAWVLALVGVVMLGVRRRSRVGRPG